MRYKFGGPETQSQGFTLLAGEADVIQLEGRCAPPPDGCGHLKILHVDHDMGDAPCIVADCHCH
jgi:hypothetical protein